MKVVCDELSGLEPSFVSRRARRIAAKGTKEFKLGEDKVLLRKPWKMVKAYKNTGWQIVVPPELREDVLHACHDELMAGHLKEKVTYARVASHFYWPGMSRDVKNYCKACTDCQTGKGTPRNRAAMGQNVHAIHPMDCLSMDLIVIPQKGITYHVICYQDTGTSMVWFDVIEESSAEACATSYMRTIVGKYGVSREIRIDRDARWLSTFYQALWRLLGQRQRITLAYRPQGDAKNERVHCTWYNVVKMYGDMVNMTDWVESFRYLEFALNTI